MLVLRLGRGEVDIANKCSKSAAMASIHHKGEAWHCQFLYHGKRHTFSLGKVTQDEAETKANQVDYLLMRLKQNLLQLPPGIDIVTFISFDGKPPHETSESEVLTLAGLRDRYLETHRNGSLEQSTLDGIEITFQAPCRHARREVPRSGPLLGRLQQHVDRRGKKNGLKGKKLSPATIRKEIVTLRTAWNWGVQMGLVEGRFSIKGLRYPRVSEKPPFMVWEEIERRVKGLTEEAAGEWWDCLYLRGKEISELLTHVKTKALQPWVHPLCCVAAYTGARRAEMLRMLVSDVDFQGNTMVIREKKRTKGKTTTRRVP